LRLTGPVADEPVASSTSSSSSSSSSSLRGMPLGGPSDELLVGQLCYAIGAGDATTTTNSDGAGKGGGANGNGDGGSSSYSFRQRSTMSAGVVSGLRRSVPSKNGTTIRNVIQTDASTDESAAGGALVDSGGRLIGLIVTTFGNSPNSSGLTFAVPADDLLKIVPSLITLRQIS
jgi:hypothetical protein